MDKKTAYLSISLLFPVIFLTACSSRTAPAPVTLLDSQPLTEENAFHSSTYMVKKGDTLFAIAWYTGNDYRDLANYNDLSAPYSIFPGQTLRLKPKKMTALTQNTSHPKVQEKTGTTTKNYDKRSVDPKKPQAYSESEIRVNNQEVTIVKPLTEKQKKPLRRSFPKTVSKWIWPTNGKVSGAFDPEASGNKGVDIEAPKGTPIVAAALGKVVYAGNALRGYGNLVIIKHTDAMLSAYAHNDKILVKEQQWVAAGQQIATMGNTGTDSVRLHFEVRYRGKSLDPLRYLPKK
ncbi:peptidoglycan DD-metalloendopeptidase family protein [Alteromonas sp. C1M14]|uniref:peptidoglycan DD-metalloendopeptidase family protein n=1 Tax=Alteromonas sp. C1M14 TaxID=2841567 RepID=UPI001C095DFD|nr:peptidoglycan DD-metalloendopeptidase family protein [Alteromonas sp. C1M14]MBU2977523.1 peptidoglycan DD-metalloendopeptidase family protein [Alteromonas sp. C1M14]